MPARKTKDGRWRVWLDLGSDPATGRRIRKKVEAKTKRLAESKATALRERHQQGEDITAAPRTLSELIAEWIDTLALEGRAANTLQTYREASRCQITPNLGALLVPKLRTREMQTTINDLAKRLSPSYIRTIKVILVGALNFAIDQGERTTNPAEKLRIPKVTQKSGRSLTSDEIHAILPLCDGHHYGLAIRLALMGLRRGELPGLRWDDFDEVHGTLAIGRQIQRVNKQWTPIEPKADSARVLTLGPKLVAALRQYRWEQQERREAMGWEESGYIFVSVRTGGVCPPPAIYEAWCDILEAAGVEPTRLHNCRHTAGTWLLANGEDIATVAEVLGHASPAITASVYVHALPHKVAGASKRLEDLYE